MRPPLEWETKEAHKDLASKIVQEVGAGITARPVVWIKARSNVLFQLFNNLRMDKPCGYRMAYPEENEVVGAIEEKKWQEGMEVKIALTV